MLAVSIFGNRQSTKDIDNMVEPNADDAEKNRTELLAVIQAATEVGNYAPGWFNDKLKLFISREKRQQLFFHSFKQELVALQGTNMVIYVGSLDFGLERKLRRMEGRSVRIHGSNDASDAVATVHQLKGGSAHPLGLKYVRSLDRNGFGIPFQPSKSTERRESLNWCGMRRSRCTGM